MALTVATNTGALMAQAAASSVNKDMELAMERLSTGKRINGAADDAAGVAISSRLTAEITGTNMAIRNAMDGQALIDTAEGAHDEITNLLQRMREVAVQALNDTNSTADRTALQGEMNALKTEVDRIAHSTSWAGIQLLNGDATTSIASSTQSDKSLELQIGSGTKSSDSLSVTIGAMSAAKLGLSAAQTPTLTETETATATTYPVPTIATAVDADGNIGNLAYAHDTSNGRVTVTPHGGANTVNVDAASDAVTTIVVEGISTSFDLFSDGTNKGFDTSTAAGMAAAITAKMNDNANIINAGISVTHGAGNAYFTITKPGGNTLTVNGSSYDVANSITANETLTATIDGVAVAITNSTSDGYSDDRAGVIQHLTDAINAAGIAGITATADFANNQVDIAKAGGLTINSGTFSQRQAVIGTIDTALETVSTQRAALGALSNRLDSTVSNLTNISSNLQGGRGRIEDADFAAETTSLAKSQILQQASTAMLAQANASKQNVLSLLQG